VPNSVRRWAPRRCWNRTRGQQQPCPVPVPSHQPVRHGARSSLKLPAPSRLQQLGSPPVTGRLRERERGRGACSAIARISLPLCQRSCMPAPACLPFSVALAVWPGLWLWLEPGILPFPSLSFSCVFFSLPGGWSLGPTAPGTTVGTRTPSPSPRNGQFPVCH
jgi:hypothetical protein